jgi:hypothetical protein
VIPGGLAEGLPDDLFDPEQLAMGIEHELEHTSDRRVAEEIAKDHLAEQILAREPQDYYTRLEELERNARRGRPGRRLEAPTGLKERICVICGKSWSEAPHRGAITSTLDHQYVHMSCLRSPKGKTWKKRRMEHLQEAKERSRGGGMEPNRKWTRAYMNRLPDSAFLWVGPGGEKDEQNRTHPLHLRSLPYKDMGGKVDLGHLRNAIARLPVTRDIPESDKPRIKKRACRILERHGGECSTMAYQHNPESTYESYLDDEWKKAYDEARDAGESERVAQRYADDLVAQMETEDRIRFDVLPPGYEEEGMGPYRRNDAPEPMRDIRLEAQTGRVFRLRTWETNRSDRRGVTYVEYVFEQVKPRSEAGTVFEGDDFACSPMHAIDTDECVRALLSFLTLRPGDTDAEFFDDYTPEQRAFADTDAEWLSIYSMEPDDEYEAYELEDWKD